MRRNRNVIVWMLVVGLLPLAAAAQSAANTDTVAVTQAETALQSAEQAGAPQYARSLYDEAAHRVRFARENVGVSKRVTREQARMRAVEGMWAATAAREKARWIGTNEAVRSLQTDIRRLGGNADVTLTEEGSSVTFNRGNSSALRIAYAQGIVDSAVTAGGDKVAADDLRAAREKLKTARTIAKANENSETANHLAYVAEMMARRAFYASRASDVARNLAPLQLQRTQLAQSAGERQAAADRAQRQEAERQRLALEDQLRREQANRAAEAAEIQRLRTELDQSRRALQQRIEADRMTRSEAERAVDEAYARYERAVASGSSTDIESARRDLEDRTITLRTVQQREKFSEQQLVTEIDRLRNELQVAQQQGTVTGEVLAQRQAELGRREQELDTYRRELAEAQARRSQLEEERQTLIADAQRRRDLAEEEARRLQQQLAEAQQTVQQAQNELQQTQQTVQQREEELKRVQQQSAETQSELQQTRDNLARREAELHQLRLEQELARITATRTDDRGLIVTLSSALFDTGKATLKPGAKSTLDKIAAQLRSDPSVRVLVEGHTDSVGSENLNLTLSQKRANVVRDYLVNAGVSPSSISSAGRGEAQPVATNTTAAGRLQNRRVELVVTRGEMISSQQ